ncbi:MAG: excinuclease ABC subunit UvrA [Nitrospirota bacterium]|nr:MAG: excinuclease ABC subunit UvrA [Nitrospirota bacterium]
MSSNNLIIDGAKQNNLKNVSLKLPHNKVIAVTGISGSGKSSLAFDTIFAEGQWRFIESLSTYARLFIEKLDRPDIESIRNIRPSIALQQHNPIRGSRSTVGTITEIYDLMRVLFARIATPTCPECGEIIKKWNPSSIARELLEHHDGEKAIIYFNTTLSPDELRKKGFDRIIRDGEVHSINELGDDIRTVPAVVDRLVIKDSSRLTDSIETAWNYGRESVSVYVLPGRELVFSSGNTCDSCGHIIHDASPVLFSFNHPIGACPECKGFGNILRYSPDLIIPDTSLSLKDGAIDPWEKPAAKWWKKQLVTNADKAGIDLNTPYEDLPAEQKDILFNGHEHMYGINDFFEELEHKRYKIHVRVFLSRYRSGVTCPSCSGKRLGPETLAYKVAGKDIAEISSLNIEELIKFFNDIELSDYHRKVANDVLEQIELKLKYLNRVGLYYLSLDRQSKTLSGGEFQRINLSNQLASHLTGTLYVLDEPTVGLHARDTETIASIMNEIAELGNTIVVVEHDKSIIEKADWIVELGPGGGSDGGSVVYSGPISEFYDDSSITARYMKGELSVPRPLLKRPGSGMSIVLEGASGNNLKKVHVDIPLQTFTVITGVSGSGKSSLIVDTLYNAVARRLKKRAESPLPFAELNGTENINDIKLIDQSPIGRSPRSNPATYLKLFDSIRKHFADQPESKARGHSAGFFSFNVPGGRCEECMGEGYQKIEMHFFEDVFVKCTSCNGTRYSNEALKVTYRDKTIHDVLNMTIEEASRFFSDDRRLEGSLKLLNDVGLGYLRLGQPATTLSGGEAQRLKVCAEFGSRSKGDTLYILDEPTVGLHMQDTAKLLHIIQKLVEAGNTVVIIEHNLDLIRTADWMIDLGPGGGDRGGRIVYEGPPEAASRSKRSETARYLAALD